MVRERSYYSGRNNSGHYNFIIIDKELIFVNDKGKNIRSGLNLSLEAIGLYAVIKAHAIDKNFAWPSLSTLENLSGTSRHTLLKYLKELNDKGVILIQKNKNKNGGKDINVYVIPSVDKEGIREKTISQGEKSTPCNPQSEKIAPCEVQKFHQDKVQKMHSKDININDIEVIRQNATDFIEKIGLKMQISEDSLKFFKQFQMDFENINGYEIRSDGLTVYGNEFITLSIPHLRRFFMTNGAEMEIRAEIV